MSTWAYPPSIPITSTGVVEADGAASGTSTITAIGCAFALAIGSIAGVGTPAGAGVAITQTTGSISGTGTPAAVGAGFGTTVASSSGVTTPNGDSATVKPTVYGASGVGTVSGVGEAGSPTIIIEADGSSAGVGSSAVVGVNINCGVGSSVGISTVSSDGSIVAIAIRGISNGIATVNAVSGALSGSEFHSGGIASVNGVSPTGLIPTTFKPIEQRRVRLPKLPRGVDSWTDTATKEFDSFFSDLHFYFNSNTFVSGVHSEVLEDGFTLTPETSVIFLMSNDSVVSSPTVAIKSLNNVPRIFIVVNTGLFPITLKDGANTVFGGSDIVLQSGKILFLVYTGVAWVGNAL